VLSPRRAVVARHPIGLPRLPHTRIVRRVHNDREPKLIKWLFLGDATAHPADVSTNALACNLVRPDRTAGLLGPQSMARMMTRDGTC
jgi:hypothetical protein